MANLEDDYADIGSAKPPPKVSRAGAFAAGLGRWGSLGYDDWVAGLSAGAGAAAQQALDALTGDGKMDAEEAKARIMEAFREGRDERRATTDAADKQHPWWYGAGAVTSLPATLPLYGGRSATTAAERALAAVPAGLVAGPGMMDSDTGPDAVVDALGSAGLSAAGAAALPPLVGKAGVAVARALEPIKAFARGHGADLASAAGKAASDMAGKIPGANLVKRIGKFADDVREARAAREAAAQPPPEATTSPVPEAPEAARAELEAIAKRLRGDVVPEQTPIPKAEPAAAPRAEAKPAAPEASTWKPDTPEMARAAAMSMDERIAELEARSLAEKAAERAAWQQAQSWASQMLGMQRQAPGMTPIPRAPLDVLPPQNSPPPPELLDAMLQSGRSGQGALNSAKAVAKKTPADTPGPRGRQRASAPFTGKGQTPDPSTMSQADIVEMLVKQGLTRQEAIVQAQAITGYR